MKDLLPGQTLVLAHREELIDQGIEDLVLANPSLSVTKEMGKFIGNVNADVIVASVPTLRGERGKRFPWDNIDKIATDEAHHGTAASYGTIYERAGLVEGTHKLHVGFTATPQRSDGAALSKVFKKIVYEYGLRKAVEQGYLVEPKGIRIETETSLQDVTSSGGDYAIGSLSRAINTPERNQLVVAAWLQYGEGRPTIGFTADILHAVQLAEVFQHYGVRAEAVWGDDPERADKIARSKSGSTTVLLNCGILTEGYNDPHISCILLARPTKSGVLYSQMVGRGTRLCEGKSDLIVIDLVDASVRNSLLTLPTLMGLHSDLDLKGRGVVQSIKKLEEEAKKYPQVDFTKLRDISQLEIFISEVNLFEYKFRPEVELNSKLTWFTDATGDYVINIPADKDDRFTIHQNILDKYDLSGYIKGKHYVGERDSLEEAFYAADNLIAKICPESMKILNREEEWFDTVPSEKQMRFLRKLYKHTGKAIPTDLTKRQVSNLISAALAGKEE